MRVLFYSTIKSFNWKATFAFLLILLFWQLIAYSHFLLLSYVWRLFAWQPPIPNWRFLSSPLNVILSLPFELTRGSLITDSIKTYIHTSSAFVISFCLSLIICILLCISTNLRQGFEPIIKAMSGIPPVTLLPIFSLALGLESGSIIALGVFGATLSTSLILLKVLLSLNIDLSKMLENLGYSSLGVWLWKFSNISESVYLAAREGLRWSLILVVVAEMQIGDVSHGIGYYINSARLNQNYESVYLGIIGCAGVSLLLQTSLSVLSMLTHYFLKKLLLRGESKRRIYQ
ncbi:hypothetical protein A6V25_31015 [Nostoc sp. ATCC 53789]|nr:hypothetical protein A6V25_31015 [Nostoc sp. ATCC 53789]